MASINKLIKFWLLKYVPSSIFKSNKKQEFKFGLNCCEFQDLYLH